MNTATGPIPVRFPIPGQVDGLAGIGEPLCLSGIAFLPPTEALRSAPPVILLRPGGSYTVDYRHLEVPGYSDDDYSCALYLAQQGFIVVATDHLGTGGSSKPQDGGILTPAMVAQANVKVAASIRTALRRRTFHTFAATEAGSHALESLPSMSEAQLAAFGHSLGAMLLTLEAGQYSAYEAVGLLGWSNHQLAPPGVDLASMMAEVRVENGYVTANRRSLRPLFYLGDIPEAVIEADEARATVTPWNVGYAAIEHPAVVAQHAGRIDVPVLHVLGQYDVSGLGNALEELAVYQAARQAGVTFFELPGSAHCHCLATTRRQLWDYMARWTRLALGAGGSSPGADHRAHHPLAAARAFKEE